MPERVISMPSVSTHSRPKAAALPSRDLIADSVGFNTQPPEGGCGLPNIDESRKSSFNTQPPEGGCLLYIRYDKALVRFQHTAARRRLLLLTPIFDVFSRFNTQPPEGGCCNRWRYNYPTDVSTHSRPKAAARII